MAAVNAADDDTAKVILLENKLLTLQPDEDAKSITIERFASEPVHDVTIQVQVPSNKIEIIIDFKKQTSKTDIEYSLKILKNFSKNWPKHERPQTWIIEKKQSNYIKKSNFIFEK